MTSSPRDEQPAASGAEDPGPGPRPPVLALALGLVLVEAAGLVGFALWSLVSVLTQGTDTLGVALALVLFCLAVAAALVAAARAVHGGRRAARAPLVTWQLLQGATAVSVLRAAGAPLAWAALVAAVVVLVALLSPPVVRFTAER
ncbi:hypothetical protein [Actinotalea sp. K2]|uniref:hypothetical protein n=1 Tax=Actinotalea sp. K2 TaxID=2939438 RepID=UPI0020170E15|nr:hypothetical protein [Actinotalea sp. K2]MCL3862749.1 hypothetical protein [Actinotalea sp. K2]